MREKFGYISQHYILCVKSLQKYWVFSSSSYEPPTTSRQPSEPVPRQPDAAGVLGQLSDLSVYDNPSVDVMPPENIAPISRQGTSGVR